jgi:hypothetical protein
MEEWFYTVTPILLAAIAGALVDIRRSIDKQNNL